MMRFTELLLDIPPGKFKIGQIVALDWYDGPTEGWCELAEPACCFYFEMIAERRPDDDLDDRLFQIREAPADTMARVLEVLSELGPPRRPVWVPIWKFSSEDANLEADQQLSRLQETLPQPSFIIRSDDNMSTISGCWGIFDKVSASPSMPDKVAYLAT